MSERHALRPRDVAALWGCSERHVRNLIRDGKLSAFRLGEKLVRITPDAIREFEQCQSFEPSNTEANGPSNGMRAGSVTAPAYALATTPIVLTFSKVWSHVPAPYHIQKRSWPSEHAEPEEQSLPTCSENPAGAVAQRRPESTFSGPSRP
jgi:excisionase family DNA binding protein